MTLAQLLQKHLRATPEEAERLLRQGSVWDSERKVRLQDGDACSSAASCCASTGPSSRSSEFALLPGGHQVRRRASADRLQKGRGAGAAHALQRHRQPAARSAEILRRQAHVRYQAAPDQPPRPAGPGAGLFRQGQEERDRPATASSRSTGCASATWPPPRFSPACKPPTSSARRWSGRGSSKAALTYVALLPGERRAAFFSWFSRRAGAPTRSAAISRSRWRPLLGDVRYGGAAPGGDLWLLCFQYSFPHPVGGRTVRVRYLPEAWRDAMGLDSIE